MAMVMRQRSSAPSRHVRLTAEECGTVLSQVHVQEGSDTGVFLSTLEDFDVKLDVLVH
jgi:hypothetical protein